MKFVGSKQKHVITRRNFNNNNFSLRSSLPVGDHVDTHPDVQPLKTVNFPFVLEDDQNISIIKLTLTILSGILYAADIISDLQVAVSYYVNNLYYEFGATVIFVFLCGLLVTSYSVYWYYLESKSTSVWDFCPKRPKVVQLICFVLHVLLLGPLYRGLETFYFAWRIRFLSPGSKRDRFFTYVVFADADLGLLRIIEASTEAAPQLLLQLYVLLRTTTAIDNNTLYIRIVSAGLSWMSFCVTLTSYHNALRHSVKEKAKMSLCSMFLYTLWKLLIIGPRFLVIALFASIYPIWLLIGVCVHWILMLCFIRYERTNFCSDESQTARPCFEWAFNLLLAWIYIFDYLCCREGRNRWKYLLLYSLIYVENMIMLLLWWWHDHNDSLKSVFWLRLLLLFIVAVVWWLGIAVMIVYYLCFHPTGNIAICLPPRASKSENVPDEKYVTQRILMSSADDSLSPHSDVIINRGGDLNSHLFEMNKLDESGQVFFVNAAATSSSYSSPPPLNKI